MSAERLRRSERERMLFGVAGGLAEYWDVDPVLVRVGFVVLAFISAGLGVILYIALAVIMPRDSVTPESEEVPPDPERLARRRNALAVILIVLGVLLLLGTLGPWFEWRYIWPIALIGIGAAIIIGRMRRS